MNRHPGLFRGWVRLGSVVALATLTTVLGCQKLVSIRKADIHKTHDRAVESVLNSGRLSPRTLDLLGRYAIQTNQGVVVQGTREELLDWYRRGGPTDLLVAIAEVSLAEAEQARSRGRDDPSLYLAAADAAQAWLALHFRDLSNTNIPDIDPRTRFTVDVYNRALSRFVESVDFAQTPAGQVFPVSGRAGIYQVSMPGAAENISFDPATFDEVFPADTIDVQGLRNRHVRFGLGAPLVFGRSNDPGDEEYVRFYPPEGRVYPATAVIQFAPSDLRSPRDNRFCEMIFFDSLNVRQTPWVGQLVPLQTDFTAPIGYLMSKADLRRLGLLGLLDPESVRDRNGIFLLEPFRDDKIPVLMVHGLQSSPLTWRDMFNDLYGDPAIREHYQFWFYMYPSGLPPLTAAALLRRELDGLMQHFDPRGRSLATRDMVVVGHSMGGLVSKTLAQDPGDQLWNLANAFPPDAFEGTEEERALVRDVFIFEPLEQVDRLVFISVPHRGAPLADSPIGRLGISLIDLPEEYRELGERRARLNAQYAQRHDPRFFQDRYPTSIEVLANQSPFLLAWMEVPFEQDVRFHTIVGDRGRGDGPRTRSDGVVAYTSSYVEGAASEVVVPAGHNAHLHPLAIEEVRRVLLLHLSEREAQPD